MDKITSPPRGRGAATLPFAATLLLMAACLAGVFAAADALHRWTVETPIVDLRL